MKSLGSKPWTIIWTAPLTFTCRPQITKFVSSVHRTTFLKAYRFKQRIMAKKVETAINELQALLLSREKELKEREEEFERRLTRFDAEHPNAGRDTDVLELNVGGGCQVSVLRRTLTQFDESMLASRFSGRWDDSLEKDSEGKFFIDQDPAIFLILINYLRQLDMTSRNDIRVPCPEANFDFCWMLEYYNLMPAVYRLEWKYWHKHNIGFFTVLKSPYGSSILTSKDDNDAFTLLDLRHFDKGVSEFTAVFDKGSNGKIGWASNGEIGWAAHHNTIPLWTSVMYLESRKIIKFISYDEDTLEEEIIEENIGINPKETSVKVICRNKCGKCSFEIEGLEPFSYDVSRQKGKQTPAIVFTGTVTVSNVKYNY